MTRGGIWGWAAVVGVATALTVVSACKFMAPPPVSEYVPPNERFRVKLRFALLVPYDKVVAAARSELKVEGGQEESAAGESDVVHFTLTEQDLRRLKAHDTTGGGGDPGGGGDASRDQIELRLSQEPNVLVAQVRFRSGGKDDQERAAFQRRAAKVFKVLAVLPGVGPAVDRDGVPKDHQFSEESLTDAGKSTEESTQKIDVNPALMGGDAAVGDAGDGGK